MGSNLSNYPNGFNHGALIREALVANPPRRNLYVGNNGTPVTGELTKSDDARYGTFLKPYSTLDYAVGQSKAGDYIWVRPGSSETVGSAGALALDVAGITIVFLGNGSNKATIEFTATAADMDVTAAGITLISPRFLTGIDAVAAAIHVAAADFRMFDVEFYDAAAKAATIQVLTTSAANRMVIDGYKYFASTTGTQKTDGIKLVGSSGIVLRNIDIVGDFTNSPINVSTTTLLNSWENINVNNTAAGPAPAMTIGANATGFAKGVKCRVASGTTYISNVAKIQWGNDCEGFSTDGNTGEPLGTVLSTGIEGKIDVIDGYFDVPTADATTDVTIRDVIGRKTDAAVTAAAVDKSIVAYVKGVLGQIGTLANAGGTATLGGMIGDLVNMTLTQRLALSAIKNVATIATGNLFTISGGMVKIVNIVGYITTAIQAQANNTKLVMTPTGGTATDLCAVLDLNAAGQYGLLTITGTFANAMVLTATAGVKAGVQAAPFITSPGVLSLNCAASNTGVIDWYIEYIPMDIDAKIVAA